MKLFLKFVLGCIVMTLAAIGTAFAAQPIARLFAVMFLAGCVSTTPLQAFDRGDVTEQQFNKDTAACELVGEEHRSADMALWGNPDYSYNRLFNTCMRSKGYAVKS